MYFTYEKGRASGGRESWAKTVGSVDRSQRGAKALVGFYLTDGCQMCLFEGQVMVEVVPHGSVKNGRQEATVWQVVGDKLVERDSFDWRREFLQGLDAVEKALSGGYGPSPGESGETASEGVPRALLEGLQALVDEYGEDMVERAAAALKGEPV